MRDFHTARRVPVTSQDDIAMLINDATFSTKSRAVLVLMLIALCAVSGGHLNSNSKRLGEACGTTYPGRCTIDDECSTMEDYIKEGLLTLETMEHCTYTSTNEIICCPSEPPRPKAVLNYTHLAALTYYDTHVQGCTAVLMTPQLLIGSTKCISDEVSQRPQQAVLGVSDLREKYQEQQVANISYVMHRFNGIAVMSLEAQLDLANMARPVTVAEICAGDEVIQGDLRATGWAQSLHSSCSLFELPMTLKPIKDCATQSTKSFLDQGREYRCLAPTPPAAASNSGGCTRCLMGAGSVLHMHRPDGSRCVAGISYPTSDDCSESMAPLYFSILNAPDHAFALKNFTQSAGNDFSQHAGIILL